MVSRREDRRDGKATRSVASHQRSPVRSSRRRARSRRSRAAGSIIARSAVAAALVIVVALTVVVVGAPHLSTRAGAQTSPYFTLSVNPTQDVRTGQAMTFTVTRTPAGTAQGLQIYAAATAWCTANFQPPTPPERYNLTLTYGTFPVHLTNPNGHCTTVTFPLDSSFRTKAGYSPPKDSTGSYPTVSGTVAAESSGGTTLHTGTTLTCNSTHPCTFVVLVYANETGEQAPGIFLGVPVTYLPPSVNTSCGGAAPGQLTTAGPDRLAQQITNWTLEGCASDLDGGKALTDNLGSGESDATALNTFADGDADLAYSAVGYGATAAFNPPNQRPYVAVPIALNAVVLAHVQSKHVTNVAGLTNVFAKLPQLHITDAQAAQLVADGQGTNALWDSPLGEGLVSQNPTLGPPSWYYSPTTTITRNASHNNQNENNGVVGTSLADATTFFATTFLHSVAPQELVSYTGKPLGVTPDFGTATPPYNIFAATGTELVAKALSPGLGQGWALTDAASAASLWGGLSVLALQTPGSIGSPTQKYVAPTVTSMQAAVPEMIPNQMAPFCRIPMPPPPTGSRPIRSLTSSTPSPRPSHCSTTTAPRARRPSKTWSTGSTTSRARARASSTTRWCRSRPPYSVRHDRPSPRSGRRPRRGPAHRSQRPRQHEFRCQRGLAVGFALGVGGIHSGNRRIRRSGHIQDLSRAPPLRSGHPTLGPPHRPRVWGPPQRRGLRAGVCARWQ